MIKIKTNNSIHSTNDSNTKFKEIVQVVIEIRDISEREKDTILQYIRNEISPIFEKNINEGPRSLMIDLSFERSFQVQKKDFSSIVEIATTSAQDKSLKKIQKLFSEKFKNATSVREKQIVSKIFNMYVKELKKGNIGKSRREFKHFLQNLLEN